MVKARKSKSPELYRTVAHVEVKPKNEIETEDRNHKNQNEIPILESSSSSSELSRNEEQPVNKEPEGKEPEVGTVKVKKPASTSASGKTLSTFIDQKTVFRTWPDAELKLQRQVIEKYEAGHKLWTKDGLLAIENQINKENPIKLPAFVGGTEEFEKQRGVTYTVEFHGYQALAFPPPSRPNGIAYSTVSLKTLPFDYSESRDLAIEMKIFNECTAVWLTSPIGQLLYSLFMKVPLPPHINKVVCFDLGTITARPAENYPFVRQAIYRHAAAMTIIECLHKRFGTMIQLFAQDTTYCNECTKVLFQKGFSVVGLHGAGGFAEIDENTLVFAPNPSFCVKEVVADIAEPAAMFWNTVLSSEDTEKVTRSAIPLELEDQLTTYYHHQELDPDTPRVRTLIQNYDRHTFPMTNLFGSVSLYTRSDVSVSHVPGGEP